MTIGDSSRQSTQAITREGGTAQDVVDILREAATFVEANVNDGDVVSLSLLHVTPENDQFGGDGGVTLMVSSNRKGAF